MIFSSLSIRSSPPRLPGDSDELTIGGRVVPYETGELPEDFVQRLHLLKKRTGLTWNGFADLLGVDRKQMLRWRRGDGALRRGLSLPGPHRPVGSRGPGPHGRRGLLDLTEGGLDHCLVNVSTTGGQFTTFPTTSLGVWSGSRTPPASPGVRWPAVWGRIPSP